eukprot:m.697020 g.697020  ORF g.697020 m.697020 type:complete len:339 (-) comp22896_c0_seq16:4489-5505(-)
MSSMMPAILLTSGPLVGARTRRTEPYGSPRGVIVGLAQPKVRVHSRFATCTGGLSVCLLQPGRKHFRDGGVCALWKRCRLRSLPLGVYANLLVVCLGRLARFNCFPLGVRGGRRRRHVHGSRFQMFSFCVAGAMVMLYGFFQIVLQIDGKIFIGCIPMHSQRLARRTQRPQAPQRHLGTYGHRGNNTRTHRRHRVPHNGTDLLVGHDMQWISPIRARVRIELRGAGCVVHGIKEKVRGLPGAAVAQQVDPTGAGAPMEYIGALPPRAGAGLGHHHVQPWYIRVLRAENQVGQPLLHGCQRQGQCSPRILLGTRRWRREHPLQGLCFLCHGAEAGQECR